MINQQLSFKKNAWTKELPKTLDSKNTLVIAYYNPSLTASPLWKELRSSFPNSIIMGCSGAGEVKHNELVDDEAVVTIALFEKSNIIQHTLTSITSNSEECGQQLAEKFSKQKLKGVYILSDGLNVNGTALIQGFRKVLGNEIILSGGLAGDGTAFKSTSVLIDGAPQSNSISAVGFYGESINFIASAEGGWSPFGPERKITKSEANIVYELDHKPALALYKEFLGEQANKLPSSALLFPLHLKSQNNQSHRDTVRTILGVDEKNQSLTFAGDMPVDSTVQLMRSGHEKLTLAAENVANKNATRLKGYNTLSLIVSCIGRRLVLGENTESEIESVLNQLPKNTFQTGFYSYGEIAPGSTNQCELHNQTMTHTLIEELMTE